MSSEALREALHEARVKLFEEHRMRLLDQIDRVLDEYRLKNLTCDEALQQVRMLLHYDLKGTP